MNEFKSDANDPLDRLLALSLAGRPEPRPAANLANRAIERSQQMDRLVVQQRRRLMVARWRLRLVHAAAGLLIVLLILLGGHRLLSERSSSDSGANWSTSSESATSNSSTTVVWLGGLLFICTVAGLAADSAMRPDRPSLVV